MGNRNAYPLSSSGEPPFALLTTPGCDAAAHRSRIRHHVSLIAAIPGYEPAPELMPCGCLMESVPWPTRSEAEGRQ